jgi:tetratricopeptide (TPR) repeat protein
VLTGCATYEEIPAKKVDEKVDEKAAIRRGDEEAYQKAVAREPDNPEIYYGRGWYYYADSSNIAAAKEWGLTLEKDPDYALEQGVTLSAYGAAERGLTNLTKPLDLSGVHLDYLIGAAYLQTVTQGKVPEAEYDEYLEKALAHFQKGYDRDITGEKHNTKDAKVIYLISIGHARNLKGDYDGAMAAYQELADAKDVDYDKSGITATIRELEGKKKAVAAYQALAAKGMYYVSASGSDDNDGLSEETAFKTLAEARLATRVNDIKAITVIGTLNQESEGGDRDEVFSVSTYGDASILITGIPHAPGARRAVLSAQGTDKNCVSAISCTIRFEHIEITGSPQAGLEVSVDGEVTLGEGARITGNNDRGVVVYGIKEAFRGLSKPGHLILDGGTIDNNKSEGGGAGVYVGGMFTMKQGSIRKNTVTTERRYGGGVYIDGSASIEGGEISENEASHGAGVYVGGKLTLSGGSIIGNEANMGGGVRVGEGAAFTQSGGSITKNMAVVTGGVHVDKGGVFTQQGGSVSGNYQTQRFFEPSDIFRE